MKLYNNWPLHDICCRVICLLGIYFMFYASWYWYILAWLVFDCFVFIGKKSLEQRIENSQIRYIQEMHRRMLEQQKNENDNTNE